ncbi:MAG: VWA domain-containing protein [bacterium]|nr:VWA domain-containing protein [bacterium]
MKRAIFLKSDGTAATALRSGLILGLLLLAIASGQARPVEIWNRQAPGQNRAAAKGQSADGPPPVLFILDASGSMAELFGGVSRMAAARLMLHEQLARLNQKVPVGLVAYGNKIPGCGSVRIYAPIRAKNRATLKSQVKQMHPAGSTPIARTLRLVGESLIPSHPGTTVVLISDGAESCGGNPAAEARKLLAKGKDVQINVIGLAVDQATAVELGDIARAGSGEYFHVRNHTDLDRAIRMSLSRVSGETPPLAEAPRRLPKNEAVEQRWSQREAPPIANRTPRPPFEIRAVRPIGVAQDDPDAIEFEIDYRFYHQRPGNFIVRMHAITHQTSAPGPAGGRVRGGDGLLAITSASHFQVNRGSGSVRIRVPKAHTGPLHLQGELWEITNVPEHLYLSNAVAAKRRP